MSGRTTTTQPFENDADACRKRGWIPGTQLVGDEGYGPTVIEITALGESRVLAKAISHNGEPLPHPFEVSWTLCCRDWQRIES